MKQWLGFLGVVALLAVICGLFAFVIPLETDTMSSNDTLCAGSNLMPDEVTPPCSGSVTKSYHLVKGEMQAYQDAKKCIDAHLPTCSTTTVKLFL